MAASTSIRGHGQPSADSRFDWDRQLDGLLKDLEQSASAAQGSSSSNVQQQQQRHYQMRSQSASSAFRSSTSGGSRWPAVKQQEFPSNGLSKSKSGHSLHQSADNMLKDLEGSLKASSNYIESHRRENIPGGHAEFHEYRSYSSNNNNNNNNDDFNLERQVQHMMPTSTSSYGYGGSGGSSGLQSANMVSSIQQKHQYSSYKVQSNQYSSTGERITTGYDNDERPGSRLKQNIDELDTLLYDLNHAKKMSDAGADYTASSITPGNVSSDDYSFNDGQQGHVKRTVQSYNEYRYQSSGGGATGKPPSPSPRRRPMDSKPYGQTSPALVRRASPEPSSKYMSSSYNYSSSYTRDQQQQPQQQPRPQPPVSKPVTSYEPPSVHTYDGTPTGVSYYTKYHSTHSHQSQMNKDSSQNLASFPTTTRSTSSPVPRTQAPPKRVDDLITELSEFDSSIKQHTGFVEPPPKREPSPEPYRPPYREPSPVRPAKQESTPAPAVYYPPGETLSQSKADSAGRGQGKGQYKAKAKGKDKFKSSDGEGKEGAAVVPICLPLCCATPCVIM